MKLTTPVALKMIPSTLVIREDQLKERLEISSNNILYGSLVSALLLDIPLVCC